MNQRRTKFRPILVAMALAIALVQSNQQADAQELPNIVIILADDLGYGDVGCFNSDSEIPTPNLDRMAKQGMRFVDAHSPCTVCTPTRYSLMTGQMAFRIPNGGRVFTGAGGPSLIAPNRLTLPQMLQDKGYTTACFGKWHIGMTFEDAAGKPIHKGGLEAVKTIDYSRPIKGGPIDCGFDHFFGTACCPTTDWLYAYIDGNKIPVPPTKQLDKATLPKHAYSNDNRPGMVAADFDLEEVDMVFLDKSKQFLKKHVAENPNKPFFLFHSAQAVHLPSFPGKQFKGKTQSGPHGDFIFELDHVVGELMNTLKQLKIDDNTLVIFASDNGPEVPTVFHMRHDHKHDGARPWRGVKRDNWEGGHRIPMIVRWPGRVPVGSTSKQITSLTDVMSTVAEIVDAKLPNDSAEDSFSMLPAMLGTDEGKPIRPYILQQGFGGKKYLAIRRGKWKYLAHMGSGGNNYENHPLLKEYQLAELAPEATGQLYDLELDPGETKNLAIARPRIAEELSALLEQSLADGRSAPVSNFEPDKNLVFKTIGQVELKLHVFEPTGHRATSQAPAVVFFFGGGWVAGSPKQFYEQSRFLADHGVVAIAAEYRIKNKHHTTPFECVQDGKSAIRWARTHANDLGINPDMIVSAGGSAGGHVAACTGIIEGHEEDGEDNSVSSIPNAMILFNPVLDTTNQGFGLKQIGEDRQTDISPCHHVRAGIVPTLLFHGTADKTVPYENAKRFARLMTEAGNRCQLESFEGKGHGFFNGKQFRTKLKDDSAYRRTVKESIAFMESLGFLNRESASR